MEKKQLIMVIIIVSCLVFAGAITIITSDLGGGGGAANVDRWYLCVNPDCGKEFKLSPDELREAMSDQMAMPMPGMGPMAIECQFCNEKTAYPAMQCQECQTVFIMDYNYNPPDECPECGYSKMRDSK